MENSPWATPGCAERAQAHSPSHCCWGFRVAHAGRTTFHLEYNVWVALSSLLYMVCPFSTPPHTPRWAEGSCLQQCWF